MSTQHTLPPDVARKYECTRTPGRFIVQKPVRMEVDLRTITLEQADELVKNGFPYLRPLKQQTSTKGDK